MGFALDVPKIDLHTRKATTDLDFGALVFPERCSTKQRERLGEEISKFYLRMAFSNLTKLSNKPALIAFRDQVHGLLEGMQNKLDSNTLVMQARQPEFTALQWKLRDRILSENYAHVDCDFHFLNAILSGSFPGSNEADFRCPIGESWYHDNYPKGATSLASPIDFSIQPAQLLEFLSHVRDGVALVETHWPVVASEIKETIHCVLPLKLAENPVAPHNESVHAFRGLVSASPRPSYLAAQTLVHEMTHNKFSSIQDLTTLFLNPATEIHYSPFVKAGRPLANLFHGVASFLADASISIKMLGKVQELPQARIEPYIMKILANVDEAQKTIESVTKFTKEGQSIFEGFCEFRSSLPVPILRK